MRRAMIAVTAAALIGFAWLGNATGQNDEPQALVDKARITIER